MKPRYLNHFAIGQRVFYKAQWFCMFSSLRMRHGRKVDLRILWILVVPYVLFVCFLVALFIQRRKMKRDRERIAKEYYPEMFPDELPLSQVLRK